GVTTLQILPGSGNLIGGRGVTPKNVPAPTYQAMKFPGAPQGLKMAGGEKPKRVDGAQHRAPATPMGNGAGYRQAFADAQEYMRKREKYERELAEYNQKQGKKEEDEGDRKRGKDKDDKGKAKGPPDAPKRDLKMETLADVMAGKIQVHIHC